MMQIRFDTKNDAFHGRDEGFEVRRILNRIADHIQNGERDGGVYDVNGNRIGSWIIE